MVLAPNGPYRMGRAYWRRGDGLAEMPCTVIPRVRVPFIGTSLALAGPRMARWMARSLIGARFVGLEFHALDLMDGEGDGLELLARHQPDLRIVTERKRLVFLSVLDTFLDAGFRSVTLDSAVRRIFG